MNNPIHDRSTSYDLGSVPQNFNKNLPKDNQSKKIDLQAIGSTVMSTKIGIMGKRTSLGGIPESAANGVVKLAKSTASMVAKAADGIRQADKEKMQANLAKGIKNLPENVAKLPLRAIGGAIGVMASLEINNTSLHDVGKSAYQKVAGGPEKKNVDSVEEKGQGSKSNASGFLIVGNHICQVTKWVVKGVADGFSSGYKSTLNATEKTEAKDVEDADVEDTEVEDKTNAKAEIREEQGVPSTNVEELEDLELNMTATEVNRNPSEQELLDLIKFDTRFEVKDGNVHSKKNDRDTGYTKAQYVEILRSAYDKLIVNKEPSATIKDPHGGVVVAKLSSKSNSETPHIVLYKHDKNLAPLAAGGFGQVAKGQKLSTGRQVVQKTPNMKAGNAGKARKALDLEAKKTREINQKIRQNLGELRKKYPNQFIEYTKSDGTQAVRCTAVMNIKDFDAGAHEFSSNLGQPLVVNSATKTIKEHYTPLLKYDLNQRREMALHVANSVELLNETGYRTTDIKPENVLMQQTPNGDIPYLIDVGESIPLDRTALLDAVLKGDMSDVVHTSLYSSEISAFEANKSKAMIQMRAQAKIESLDEATKKFFNLSKKEDKMGAEKALEALRKNPLFPASLTDAPSEQIMHLIDNGRGGVKSLTDESQPVIRKEILNQLLELSEMKKEFNLLDKHTRNIQYEAAALTLLEMVSPGHYAVLSLYESRLSSEDSTRVNVKDRIMLINKENPKATTEAKRAILGFGILNAGTEQAQYDGLELNDAPLRTLTIDLLFANTPDEKQAIYEKMVEHLGSPA